MTQAGLRRTRPPVLVALTLVAVALVVSSCSTEPTRDSIIGEPGWVLGFSSASAQPGEALCADLEVGSDTASLCWEDSASIGVVARKTVGGGEFVFGLISPEVIEVTVGAPGSIEYGAASQPIHNWMRFLQEIPLGEGGIAVTFHRRAQTVEITIDPDGSAAR